MTINNPKDFGLALFLLALSTVLLFQTNVIETSLIYAMGPTFFPRALLWVMVAFSALLLWQSLSFRATAVRRPVFTGWEIVPCRWAVVAMVALYLILLPFIHYVPATGAFLFACMLLLGPRTWRHAVQYALVSLLVTAGLWYVFAQLLKVFLP